MFEPAAIAAIHVQIVVVVRLRDIERRMTHPSHELEGRNYQISTAGRESVPQPVDLGTGPKGLQPGFGCDPSDRPPRAAIWDNVRPAGQLARQALGALEVVPRDGLLAMNRKSRVDPARQRALELVRQPLSAVWALEHAASKKLFHEPKVWSARTRPGVTSRRSRIARTLGTIASRAGGGNVGRERARGLEVPARSENVSKLSPCAGKTGEVAANGLVREAVRETSSTLTGPSAACECRRIRSRHSQRHSSAPSDAGSSGEAFIASD